AALRLGDRNPSVIRHLVEALKKQGKLNEAEEVLKGLNNRADLVRADLLRDTATLAILQGRKDQAVRDAIAAVQADSRDYRDHLWLGDLLAQAGGENAARAEDHLRRAARLAEKESDPYVALVAFLAAQKDRKIDAELV